MKANPVLVCGSAQAVALEGFAIGSDGSKDLDVVSDHVLGRIYLRSGPELQVYRQDPDASLLAAARGFEAIDLRSITIASKLLR